MVGAIIGDIAGSRFEWHNIKTKDFELFHEKCCFTDDTVMTLAVSKALLESKNKLYLLPETTVQQMQSFGQKYPRCGFGGMFMKWVHSNKPTPYHSYGNGAAMRVSGCAYAARSLEEAKALSLAVTGVTHNHPEGFKGAEATAAATYLARNGMSMSEIRDYITTNYYDMDFTLDEIRDEYKFDVSCQGSVPQALEAFFESTNFEDAIRNAISIGGDSDTIAAITGSVAEAYYGVPENIRKTALGYLDEYLLSVLLDFESK